MSEGDVVGEYYYNIRTRMVEHGRQSPWEHLMGPYETHEDAERALEIAEARNLEWDEDDTEWDETWDEDDETREE
ncbi:MAG: SPOR domain-containing protein [Demequinaceae bacterium]|nr:SPOR domain-containing protein [Demequinaceae bacterium]